MVKTKEHGKGRDPKPQSDKKDPKKDPRSQEGPGQGIATSCCSQQLWERAEKCGSLLREEPDKIQIHGECKAKKSGEALDWWVEEKL